MNKVAVIGLGNIAIRHRKNLKHLFPKCTLFAMSASGRIPNDMVSDCDMLVESVDDLIAHGIQMAVVASPAPFHSVHAIPLMKAGIPVLIEKPIVTNLTDLAALNQAADLGQSPVAVGYCLRYLPSAEQVKALIESKAIGQLYNATVEIGQYLPDWRPGKDFRTSVSANADLGGGALFELSHELDYSRWILGELDIQAAILRSSDTLALDVEDSVDLLAMSEQGAVVSIHMDFLQRAAYRRCRFIGSKGTLEWDLLRNSIVLSDQNGQTILYEEPNWDKNIMYVKMIEDFIRMQEGNKHRCILLDDAGKTVALIEEIRKRARP